MSESPSKMPLVPASIGDVIDRLTILNIKHARLSADDPRRAFVEVERDHLRGALVDQCCFDIDDLLREADVIELAFLNDQLWDIEDGIRDCLKKDDYGQRFVELARQVPIVNDRRSAAKYKLNRRYESELVEVKSYEGFEI